MVLQNISSLTYDLISSFCEKMFYLRQDTGKIQSSNVRSNWIYANLGRNDLNGWVLDGGQKTTKTGVPFFYMAPRLICALHFLFLLFFSLFQPRNNHSLRFVITHLNDIIRLIEPKYIKMFNRHGNVNIGELFHNAFEL